MKQTRLNKAEKRHFVGNKIEIFLCVLENAVSTVRSQIPKINICKVQSYQFVLLIFRFEVLVLLREIKRDVFLSWLSLEYAAVAAISVYLCQVHKSVLLLSKEADFNTRTLKYQCIYIYIYTHIHIYIYM